MQDDRPDIASQVKLWLPRIFQTNGNIHSIESLLFDLIREERALGEKVIAAEVEAARKKMLKSRKVPPKS